MHIHARTIQRLLVAFFACILAVGAAHAAKKEKDEFPNTTRKEPKAQITESTQKKLSKAYDQIDKNEIDAAEATLSEIANNSRSSNYEKAAALVGLANIAYEKENPAKSVEYNNQAIALDALDNRAHFNAIYQNAQIELQEEHYAESMAAMDRWLALTRSEKPDAYALKANALYRLERFPEAAETMKKAISLSDKPNETWYQILLASYKDAENFTEAARLGEELWTKEPTNKRIALQLASIYLDAASAVTPDGKDKTPEDEAKARELEGKALATLERAYNAGLLTEERELKQLYQTYNYSKQPEKATAVILAGMEKGILKPTGDTYRGLADSYMLTAEPLQDSDPRWKELSGKAADVYGQAAALVTDNGEMDMQRGHLLIELERWADAKAALTSALSKGKLKREAACWILLGNAEAELGNDAAAIAAYEKARSFPDPNTKKMAESWLKNMKAGNRKR